MKTAIKMVKITITTKTNGQRIEHQEITYSDGKRRKYNVLPMTAVEFMLNGTLNKETVKVKATGAIRERLTYTA